MWLVRRAWACAIALGGTSAAESTSPELRSVLAQITAHAHFRHIDIGTAVECRMPAALPSAGGGCKEEAGRCSVQAEASPLGDSANDAASFAPAAQSSSPSNFNGPMLQAMRKHDLHRDAASFTGYNGSALWDTMHASCAHMEVCRLVSALHTLTSLQIAQRYYEGGGGSWEANPAFFVSYAAVAESAAGPQALVHTHYALAMLAAAAPTVVASAARRSALDLDLDRSASNRRSAPLEGTRVHSPRSRQEVRPLLEQLEQLGQLALGLSQSPAAISFNFNQSSVFGDTAGALLLSDFQNVSEVLHCVACEKCKLHALVDWVGFGTALKALALLPKDADADGDGEALLPTLTLTRTELTAFVHTFAKLAEGVHLMKEYRAFTPAPSDASQEEQEGDGDGDGEGDGDSAETDALLDDLDD
jgi:hypothetical protein